MAGSAEAVANDERLKVLISAYACGPGEEPEAAAGWAFATAAAERHDVWVVTRKRFEPAVRSALADQPHVALHLTVAYLDLSGPVMALKRGPGSLYWYYALWQRQVRMLAQRLHDQVGFDVMHHVTFANDWLPCGPVGAPSVPLVWGPVGGASRPVWRFGRGSDFGVLTELARGALVTPARMLFGDRASRRASIVVAQNADVARRFRRARKVVVEPNAVMPPATDGGRGRASSSEAGRAVMVSRLIGWKGGRLALATLAQPDARNWTLDVFGDGYDRDALVRRAARLGISDRVAFRGHRPEARSSTSSPAPMHFSFPRCTTRRGGWRRRRAAWAHPSSVSPWAGRPYWRARTPT